VPLQARATAAQGGLILPDGIVLTEPISSRMAIPSWEETCRRIDRARHRFLEDAQYEKLIGSSSETWFRAIVEVGRTYGLRVGGVAQHAG